jgi:hypothetical protein
MTAYAQINLAQVDAVTGIYRGTLSGLSWIDDTGAEVAGAAPVSGGWVNVQGISGRTGVAYVSLADPAADTLNLAVTWSDQPAVQPVITQVEPGRLEPDQTDPAQTDPEVTDPEVTPPLEVTDREA